jgi:8-oxo-dGTP diphosphatase
MTAPYDWTAWKPKDIATLLFIIERWADGEEPRILLIEKKRGLGAGKVNAPGGRLEPGESAFEAAIRELKEEIGVEATNVRELGEVSFHFLDGYDLHCHVFRADACLGTPIETDEANPFWVAISEIPYARMWSDDATWLPHLIAGRRFQGRYVFDNDTMLTQEVEDLGAE